MIQMTFYSTFVFSLVIITSCVVSLFHVEATAKELPYSPIKDLFQPYVKLIDGVYRNLQDEAANITEVCKKETKTLSSMAQSGNVHALKFFDATGKPLSGILTGGTSFLGFFSECLQSSIEIPANPVHDTFFISGKYCLAKISVSNSSNAISHASGLAFAKSFKNPTLGVCVPQSCLSTDVHFAVNQSLFVEFSAQIAGDPICHEELELIKDNSAISVLSVCSLLVALSILATLMHLLIYQKNKSASSEAICGPSDPENEINEAYMFSFLDRFILCFSLKRNIEKLLCVSKTSGNQKTIDALNGIRFITMAFVVLLHTFSFGMQDLFYRNPNIMLQAPTYLLSQIFANGTLIVDTFYFMSGLLVTYVGLKAIVRNQNRMNLTYYYLHRIVRLSPLLLIVVAFCATVLRYLGSGPNWLSTIQMYDAWCKQNWWLTVLYLQNFVNTNNMCLGHAWYLATDFQFYVVTPPILILLSRKFLYGAILMAIYFLINVVTTATLTVINHYPAVPYMNALLPLDVVNGYFKEVYIKPYCRMGPYLVGMLVGYLFVKKPSLHMNRMYVTIAWISAITLNLYILFAMYGANNGDLPSATFAAFYSTLARTFWAGSIAWMTIACTYGYGGIVNDFLSWKAMVPLSRLTYCAYLIHPVLMAIYNGTTEIEVDFSCLNMIYLFVAHLVCTYAVSFVITIIIESPFIALENLMLTTKRNRAKI